MSITEGDKYWLRNLQIYHLVKNGVPVKKIAERNNITRARVLQIVDRVETIYKREKDELYCLIHRSGKAQGRTDSVIGRTYINLRKNGFDTISDLVDINLEDYRRIQGIGRAQISIIRNALCIEKSL